MIKPSLAVSIAMLQALANQIDQGSGNAAFVIYDDAKPANITDPTSSSARLVTLELPKPCLKQVHTDRIELFPTNSGLIVKTGTAVWARLFNGAGAAVMDFDCVVDMDLDTVNLVLGSTYDFDSIELYPPI